MPVRAAQRSASREKDVRIFIAVGEQQPPVGMSGESYSRYGGRGKAGSRMAREGGNGVTWKVTGRHATMYGNVSKYGAEDGRDDGAPRSPLNC